MIVISVIIFIFLVGLDQLTKYLAVIHLAGNPSTVILNNILNFTYLENTGAAFGIMQGGYLFFLIITPIILSGLIYYYVKLPRDKIYNWVKTALLLILAGAVGNYIDRIRLKYVVDFIEIKFIRFPVFNMADIYVVAGTMLLAILLLFFIPEDKRAF